MSKRTKRGKRTKILEDIKAELDSASEGHKPMHSPHEGWAVILEEVDELWDEVKLKSSKRDKARMRKEAIQIAAMAARFVSDLIDD